MDTEPPPPDPGGPPAGTGVRHELEVAARSGRYALTAALVAAMISSFVSAGAAVYVSLNQLDRGDRLTAAQALRTDRTKLYTDFLAAENDYETALSVLSAVLVNPLPLAAVYPKMFDVGNSGARFLKAIDPLYIAGSEEMFAIANRYVRLANDFARDHIAPYTSRYSDPAAFTDEAEWQKAKTTFGAACAGYIASLQQLNGEFLLRARKDLN